MTQSAEELMDALEAVPLEGEMTVEELGAALERRAPLLEAIVALDPSTLSASTRDRMKSVLEAALTADARTLEGVQTARDAVGARLTELVDARGAVKGYRSPPERPGSVLETA